MSCSEHNLSGIITDEAALHLDACPSCRARFDALHPPLRLPRPERPAQRRSMPSPALLAAAALLIGIGFSADLDRPPRELGESILESEEPSHLATAEEEEACSLEPEICPA